MVDWYLLYVQASSSNSLFVVGAKLIGLAGGSAMGLIIKLIVTKKYIKNRAKTNKAAEVVLIIECNAHELEMVRSLLWDNHALGISKLDLANQPYILAEQG